MQVSEFIAGGFVAHKVYLDGIDSKFSIWVDRFGNLSDAARYDSRNREYSVNRNSRVWARLDGRAQIIAADLQRAKLVKDLQARRAARGNADPLNRLTVHINRAIDNGATPVVEERE